MNNQELKNLLQVEGASRPNAERLEYGFETRLKARMENQKPALLSLRYAVPTLLAVACVAALFFWNTLHQNESQFYTQFGEYTSFLVESPVAYDQLEYSELYY